MVESTIYNKIQFEGYHVTNSRLERQQMCGASFNNGNTF